MERVWTRLSLQVGLLRGGGGVGAREEVGRTHVRLDGLQRDEARNLRRGRGGNSETGAARLTRLASLGRLG